MSKPEVMRAKGPIFVVGSPRSGTSILTWCLGQHPSILPLEESGWMGRLAIDLGAGYQVGSQFGERSQLSALGVERDAFFEAFGEAIDTVIHRHRNQLERNSRRFAQRDPSCVNAAFNVSRCRTEPKSRWVDGTPEYSLHICGLRKLFPNAKFVHIVRDVRSVVKSMLHFRPGGAAALVKTEQEAYEYWLKTVEACAQAERALGTGVIHRLRYDDLVNQPEKTFRELLAFLDEPYAEACIEPLVRRINSSAVPSGYQPHDPDTDKGVIERALSLSEQLLRPGRSMPPEQRPSPAIKNEFEASFEQRIAFAAGLDAEYASAQQKVSSLSRRLGWCGTMLAINVLLAVSGMLLAGPQEAGALRLWLASSLACMAIYAFFRRAGLAQLFARLGVRFGRRRATPAPKGTRPPHRPGRPAASVSPNGSARA